MVSSKSPFYLSNMKTITLLLLLLPLVSSFISSPSFHLPTFYHNPPLNVVRKVRKAITSLADVSATQANLNKERTKHRLDGEDIRGPITPMSNGIVVRVSYEDIKEGRRIKINSDVTL